MQAEPFWKTIERTILFLIHPAPNLTVFGITPRDRIVLLLAIVVAIRQARQQAAAYWVLLALSFAHLGQVTGAACVLVLADLLMRPLTFWRFSVGLPVGLLVILNLVRDRIFLQTIGLAQDSLTVPAITAAFALLLAGLYYFRVVSRILQWFAKFVRPLRRLRLRLGPLWGDLCALALSWLVFYFALWALNLAIDMPRHANIYIWGAFAGRAGGAWHFAILFVLALIVCLRWNSNASKARWTGAILGTIAVAVLVSIPSLLMPERTWSFRLTSARHFDSLIDRPVTVMNQEAETAIYYAACKTLETDKPYLQKLLPLARRSNPHFAGSRFGG